MRAPRRPQAGHASSTDTTTNLSQQLEPAGFGFGATPRSLDALKNGLSCSTSEAGTAEPGSNRLQLSKCPSSKDSRGIRAP